MSPDQTRNVSRTAELNAFIRGQVASGQCQNASEVVRAGLRLLIQSRSVLEPNVSPIGRGRDGH
ncbi:ribbon-helix-helix domain-containing protein [Microvirga splendida]|uniref:Type II toxin-antitoxin system ParD family antitoxin n=1 Tax=Microvirga splendida TaxID=2795727 RepID=A0ABS0Y4I5_9HYPH|nr:type II toxin-antitoxin system ParD family antitoxin [Microvirga splendida]MBJ6127214.1 type II toxin-antitoxin system ParD family antitoxin [Microvirga splendida]